MMVEFPKVLARLMLILHNINMSAMVDAPEW